ncbi:MAG: glycoside hydrolase family 57 protein [Candidatus Gastranaerophilaceae bacterium]
MISVRKKLSIAFYWHMHQPVYQLNADSDYLMPWVRLHGVKDYLDMLLIMKDFENLKLNFNLVPVLLDSFIDYGEKGSHDIHSRLTVTETSDLTNDDKEFILNNFFDANYSSMIYKHEPYNRLYQKRFAGENANVCDFSDQEYSDIMAWFNLVWVDPIYKNMFPELNKLLEKGENYTLKDREEIIELHRKIIRMIIPTYKEFLEKGRIEITTSPYYHPILPILLDIKASQENLSNIDPSLFDLNMAEDAKLQTKYALDRVEELFGKRPSGIWPPENSISPQELELFKELGIDWAVSDEGILTNSIDFEFIRDFKGYLEDPYFLMKAYKYKTKNSDIQLVFRDSVLPNLISFEYANHDPKVAAADLYDRIKVIQNKLQSSPDKNHLLTIAMDGENCWENYVEDGHTFLETIYSMIEEDETLETVLISDYLAKEKHPKKLEKIHSGSWVNKNFQLWIAEPVKNLAWTCLKQAKEDLNNFARENPQNENLKLAHKELMIDQGSDWFWWYGEPNDSGQDHIFDYLFREHLKNAYRYLGLEQPAYLNSPLISTFTKPSRYPKDTITPKIDGMGGQDDEEWLNAGCINMPDGPVLRENKLFDKICYGADENNFYLRLYLNGSVQEDRPATPIVYQFYVYMRNCDKKQLLSSIRVINKTENIFPIMREKFHNELRIAMVEGKLYPTRLTKAMCSGLWAIQNTKNIKTVFQKVIDISVPFENLDIASGERLEFFFANANFGIKDSFIPQDVLLNVQRP